VNDAFGSCHRAHASIVGPPGKVPSAAGMLLQREVETLSTLLDPADRPYVVVIGGSKVADKIGVVRNLLERADEILLGGAMCFTFLKATGAEVGRSLLDTEHLADVEALMKEPRASRIELPSDVVCAESVEAGSGTTAPADAIPSELMGVDIGPQTANRFASSIARAKTLFWNGPMGVFENPSFAAGTRAVADAVAACDGFTATGGGDVSAALKSFGMEGSVDFASTGGGASLEFLEGKTLPGIAALSKER
jgi:phosphoglycerate kinase